MFMLVFSLSETDPDLSHVPGYGKPGNVLKGKWTLICENLVAEALNPMNCLMRPYESVLS